MERTDGQKLIEHRTALIQSCPQAIWARIGLTKQGLAGHRLMGSLDRSMIRWSAHPCEDQINAQSKQPQVQAGGKRRRGGVIKEDGVMIEREPFW